MLGARIIPKKTADFFRTLVRDSIKFREREGIIRPDMIHLLMQVREDDLREDGSSRGVNPESEISSMPNDTRNTKISKPSFFKWGLVGEEWWKVNLVIIELWDVRGMVSLQVVALRN
jgi:cytochrome P450 family 9